MERPREGAVVIDVERHSDERGHLARTSCERDFAEHGAPVARCTRGSIFLVMVDLRAGSPTRCESLRVERNARNVRLAHVPERFAGYQTLEGDTEVPNERIISERDRAWPAIEA